MGNTINAALREPTAFALVEAIAPFDNLHIRQIEAYWRVFYDHATSFALTNTQLRAICSHAARLLDPHAATQRAIEHADQVFRVFAGASNDSRSDSVLDALEFLSAIVFIAAEPLEDKVDLIFDSWDMSEDGALDLDEFTISLKSTLLGLTKVLRQVKPQNHSQGSKENSRLAFLDDDEIEVLAERLFREIAKVSSSSTSLNQTTITCDQFRAYCVENKAARALFELFDHADSHTPDDDVDPEDDALFAEFGNDSSMIKAALAKVDERIEVSQIHESVGDATLEAAASKFDQGDEFLAVKPWKGAIVAPSKAPPLSKGAPDISIGLSWIFGYSAQESKNNARYCPSNTNGKADEIVYPAAAACVVLNIKSNTQRHFLAHTDDVLTLCLHPKQPIMASGEIGKKPKILVWDLTSLETLCVLQGFHQRGVLQLAFQSATVLLSIGGDDDHSIGVYETKDGWRTASLLAHAKGNKATPLHIAPLSQSDIAFASCGEKYVEFWSCSGKTLASKKAILGKKGSPQPFPVAETIGSDVVVGTNDGSLYRFAGNELSSVIKAHSAAVFALHYHNGSLVSGSKDGQVSVWDDKLKLVAGPFQIKELTTATQPAYFAVRSCCLSRDKSSILIGTLASEIYEIDAKTGRSVGEYALVTGHFRGETWGLATHPSKPECCSVGDDQTLRLWNLETRREIRSASLPLPARACAYSPDGKMIAVGLGADGAAAGPSKGASKARLPAGGFLVLSATELGKLKEACYDPKKWVSDVKFSPDGKVLAVASHDTSVYLYDVLHGFAKRHVFRKHASYLTHIDFSSDGQHLQSTCGAYELLFSEVKTARHVTNASSLRDERWHTMTCTLGWAVQGIWEEGSDGTDVNAVDRSHDGSFLATGDDFGKVKVFRYPCALERASAVELRGHASHVTNVRWAYRDVSLVSTGGNDRCVFVWRHDRATSAEELRINPKNALVARGRQSERVGIDDDGDDDDSDAFTASSDDVGDEFMAVKPWLGAIVAPTDGKALKPNSASPDARLVLERIHGYQAQGNTKNNARYDSQGRVVYHTAAIGVVYDRSTQRQQFFRQHDDDIVALCGHPNGSTFATAQMGKRPKIYTWDASDPSKMLSCLEGFHQRVVLAVAFSSDGKKLGTVGGDDDHSIAIYSWHNGILVASAKGERANVSAIAFHAGQWITCGDKHVRFWREQGKNLTSKKAVFGKAKHKNDSPPSVFHCVVSFGTHAVVGASNGDLYVFDASSNELSRIVTAHTAHVYALFATANGDELLSGGKDGVVMIWDASFRCTFQFSLQQHASAFGIFDTAVRSVSPASGRSARCLLLGTQGSDLVEIDASRTPPSCAVITRGHAQLEVWGLACHPSRPEYATVGDDQLLRVWELTKKTMLRARKLDAMARACAIHASTTGTTDVIAVGLGGRHAGAARNAAALARSGAILLLSYADCDAAKPLFDDKPSKQPISDLKFAPNGSALAVGAHDHCIYVYKISEGFKKIVRTATFNKHQSYITHLDFSSDGRVLQSNCGAYELLFSDASTGKHITSASSTRDVAWHSWTCVLGWPVQGIWPPCSDGTDVNAVARNAKGDLLVTSDDFGLVKLFRYPCIAKNAGAVEHRGHASHVTNVRWTRGDSHVVSVGGNDRAVMEWRLVSDGDSMGTTTADEIKEEIEISDEIEEAIYEEPGGDEFMAVKPWLGAIVPPSNAPTSNAREPDVHLELDWVYGYQTELSKQNVLYNACGEIVYHTAAVGVIYDRVNHLQKHHVSHNDDIMSFAMSPARDVVATGERGKKPVVRLWDAHTGELRCELKGTHSRGVLSLAFSSDGKRIVSVGDDDDHSLALWEDQSHGSWRQPKVVATSKGDKGVNRFVCFGRDGDSVVSGGAKHVLFWRIEGKTLGSRKGKVSKRGTLQLFPSGCFFGNDLVTGTASGELYVWTGDEVSRVVKAHDGESSIVSAAAGGPDTSGGGGGGVLISGGKDGKIILWNSSYQSMKTFDVGALCSTCLRPAICSASMSADTKTLLIGTASSDILEMDAVSGAVLHGATPLVSGHFTMELWGLACHPTQRVFTSTGDDGTLRTWDMNSRRLLAVSKLPHKARACAYSPDGAMLAVGLGGDNGVRRKGKAHAKEGAIVVLRADDGKPVFEDRPAKEWISDIKFSPNGSTLAVGSHDNAIHLYSSSSGGDFKKRKPFAKHNSYITHFDFSSDSKQLQSNCGAYELLFCDVSSGEQLRSASALKDVAWATWTCTLGWPVQGIWPECADGTDVNAVCASASRTLLATGDDSGRVKMFRYPCTIKGVRGLRCVS
ncbi:hypothetical protein PINS_up018761 [Pythium insidiosum]|nr:hypothetical protein PINS_up018761 [Pythium insidiosum]